MSREFSAGFVIQSNGDVILEKNGVRRKATREEALQLRANLRWAFGEEIADAAGIEPE